MIRNLQEIHRGHERVIEQTAKLFDEGVQFAADSAEQHVQRYPEFHPRSGKLQQATTHRFIKNARGRILKLSNPLPYAAAIDLGARPHPISAPEGHFLRFRGKDGRIIFRKSVRHRGNRPYKFLYNATDAAYRLLGQFMREGMTRIARRF